MHRFFPTFGYHCSGLITERKICRPRHYKMDGAAQILVKQFFSIIILVMAGMFLPVFSQAQPQEGQEYATPECYPPEYTFEKAEDFAINRETERALWFYINLFNYDPDSAVLCVRKMTRGLNDPEGELRKSFAMYFSFDPDNLNSSHPGMDVNNPVMRKKSRYLEEIISCLDDNYWSNWRTQTLNMTGVKHYRSGEYDKAQVCFDKAISHNPTGQLLFNRGYLHSRVGNFQGAINDFSEAIKMEYRLAEAYYQRGYNMAQLKNKEEAIQNYTTAIEMDSTLTDAFLNRGFELYLQGDYEEALPDFEQVLQLEPANADGWVSLGFALHRLGKTDEACVNWQKAYDLGIRRAGNTIEKYCK